MVEDFYTKYYVQAGKRFRRPTIENFRRSEYPDLCECEDALVDAATIHSRQLARILNISSRDITNCALPEVLVCLLDRMDEDAAVLAAATYLESRGYSIKKGGIE